MNISYTKESLLSLKTIKSHDSSADLRPPPAVSTAPVLGLSIGLSMFFSKNVPSTFFIHNIINKINGKTDEFIIFKRMNYIIV